jgi:hypothetical protein
VSPEKCHTALFEGRPQIYLLFCMGVKLNVTVMEEHRLKMSVLVFGVVTPYGLANKYIDWEHTITTLSPEDGSSMFLRNVGR